MTALLDTGFLLAVLDTDDELHPRCTTALLAESHPPFTRCGLARTGLYDLA
jgi:hypothetical protein